LEGLIVELKNSIFAKTLRSLYKVNLNKSNEVHSTVIDVIFKALIMANDDLNQARLEMAINTATGSWLDYWGDFFNIPRERKESDEQYSARIIQETIEPKVTLNAIKRATARWLNRKNNTKYTQKDINIFEPWKYLLKYSQRGLLSGNAKMTDSEYWRYGVIEVSIPDTESLSFELMSYLNTIKAAGVQIFYSYRPYWDVIDGYGTVDPVFESRTCNNFISYIQPYSKPHVDGLYLLPNFEFSGMTDSDFAEGLNSSSHPLSGFPVVDSMVGIHRDLPLVWDKIRYYEGSYLTSLPDISTVLSKSYEDTTINDALELENSDNPHIKLPIESQLYNIQDTLNILNKGIDTITVSDLVRIEVSDEKSYEIMYEFNITLLDLMEKFPDKDLSELTPAEILELAQESLGKQRQIGRLSHSLLPIQITTLDEIDYHKSLVLNYRYIESSPVFNSLIKSGFLKGLNSITLLNSNLSPQDVMRYYSYGTLRNLSIQQTIDFENIFLKSKELKFSPDNENHKSWLSELKLKGILGEEYVESTGELTENNHVINELLKVEPVYYNVLMPTVITTLQL
jgi:hypothetical protein